VKLDFSNLVSIIVRVIDYPEWGMFRATWPL